MSIRSHAGTSLLTSGIVTLVLAALPGSSFYWGLGLVALGLVVGLTHVLL